MKFKHKGYTLTQTECNYHFIVSDKNGHVVMHVPYNKPITEEKAKEFIEDYIFFAGNLENIEGELLGQYEVTSHL